MNEKFLKKNRLLKSNLFHRVQKKCNKKHSKYFSLLYTQGNTRIGLTVSTKVGNSPQRNYIKRCVREFFRKNKALFVDKDVVLIANPSIVSLACSEIHREILKAIEKK